MPEQRPVSGSGSHNPNVRFGSLADICSALGDVRFTSESGHVQRNSACLLWANSGPSRFVAKSAAWGESGLLFDPPYRADIVDPVLG
jgi:hypothetical protein